MEKDPKITAKKIIQDLNEQDINISISTLRRTLKTQAIQGCRPKKTPLFNKKHVKARLQFANEHINKDSTFWASVLWSYETKIELFGYMNVSFV